MSLKTLALSPIIKAFLLFDPNSLEAIANWRSRFLPSGFRIARIRLNHNLPKPYSEQDNHTMLRKQ